MTLQFLIVMIASAINDRLRRKLDYVEEERRILQERLEALTGGKRLSFTAQQRRRLAEAGKLLSPDERPWAELLRKTFGFEVVCQKCKSPLRLIALIKSEDIAKKILTAMHLLAEVP